MQGNYQIKRAAISTELARFVMNYFLIKKLVHKTMSEFKYISPYEQAWGLNSDEQIPDTYCCYADIAMETLLTMLEPVMQEAAGAPVVPTYSYARIYKKGDELVRHKDRASCEFSTTLNLGGDAWPIFVEPDATKGIVKNNQYIPSLSKGKKVELHPGDMLIYRGCEVEHWREPFLGEQCVQVFLHYNIDSPEAQTNIFDGRPHIGLPAWFKGKT